jgi:serine/threonine-protein kinase
MDLAAGTLIGGRYRLERLLGRGGMGEVWAAKHTVTRRDVALKFLNVDQGTVPQMRRRFLREARAATAVNHPNVIQIHDVFELDDETPVMVMDLLTGEALSDKLARQRSLSVEETAAIMAPVVSAVGSAHSLGIVHRDLKPENIFLARTGEGETMVKVLDFGIAKLGSAMDLGHTGAITGTGAVLGTPYYMALEQAYGEKDIDHRADIWSLGVILYECLSARRPISGDNFGQIVKFLNHGTIPTLAEIAPNVPEDLSALVARMLQRAREDRPEDLREVLTVLRRYTGAAVRTFGGPRPPQTSGVHEAPEILRVDNNPTRALEDSLVKRPSGETRPVISEAEMPRPSRPSRPSGDIDVAETVSSERPQNLRISTGKKGSPNELTLSESAAAMPASPAPAPRASHKTALIAVGGAVVGIAATIAVVLATVPKTHGSGGSEAARPATSGIASAPVTAATIATPPKPTTEPAVDAPRGPATADPSASVPAALPGPG